MALAAPAHLWPQTNGTPDGSSLVCHGPHPQPQTPHDISFCPLTFHVSMDVVHKGLDGVGEVPRVLLDADLDQAPATNGTLFFLLELWGRKVA